MVCFFSCKEESFNVCYNSNCLSDEYCVDGRCVKVDESQDFLFRDQPIPKKMTISNLILTRYGEIKLGGVPYDDNSRLDIYIIAAQNSVKIYDFPTFQNAQRAPLNIPLPTPFEITKLTSPLVFNLYDVDVNLTDEFMGVAIFSIFKRMALILIIVQLAALHFG